jgi:hypothetical protein
MTATMSSTSKASTPQAVIFNVWRWRFTLREMLLALLAIGLAVAWLMDRKPWREHFTGSDFLIAFRDTNLVDPICERLGAKQASPRWGGFGGSGVYDVAEYEASCYLETPNVRPGAVVRELSKEVEKMLAEHGCTQIARGVTEVKYTSGAKEVPDFRYEYSHGSVRGHLYVYALAPEQGAPDSWRLVMIAHEHRE